jgi:hypothetical protein
MSDRYLVDSLTSQAVRQINHAGVVDGAKPIVFTNPGEYGGSQSHHGRLLRHAADYVW